MTNKVEYYLESDNNIMTCVVEIDLDSEGIHHPSHYEDGCCDTQYGNSIKTDIVLMSKFWDGHPKTDDFESHLSFFLKILGKQIGHYILDGIRVDDYIIQSLLNIEEGYFPVFGEGIHINVVSYMEPEDLLGEIKMTKLGVSAK